MRALIRDRYAGNGTTGCVDVDGCSPAVNPPQAGSGSPCAPSVACSDLPAASDPTGRGFTCGACPEGTAGNGTACLPCAITVAPLRTSFPPGGAVARSADLALFGSAAPPPSVGGFPCPSPGALSGLAFSWTVTTTAPGGATAAVAALRSASRSLVVPARTLPAGATATARLLACYAGGGAARAADLCGSASVAFAVEASPLVAALRGANASVPADAPVALSAAASFDPDGEPGPLSFRWTCAEASSSGPCLNASSGLPVDFSSGQQDGTQPAEVALALRGGAAYAVSVAVSKGGRVSVASGTLTVDARPLAPLVAAQGPPGGALAVPSDKLVVLGSATAPFGGAAIVKTWWEVVSAEPLAAGVGAAPPPPPPLDLSDTAVRLTPENATSLVLAPGALAPRARYALRLNALDANGGRGSATVEVATCGPPRGEGGTLLGALSVSPLAGEELSTVFEVPPNRRRRCTLCCSVFLPLTCPWHRRERHTLMSSSRGFCARS